MSSEEPRQLTVEERKRKMQLRKRTIARQRGVSPRYVDLDSCQTQNDELQEELDLSS
jgi:hypothetical protein